MKNFILPRFMSQKLRKLKKNKENYVYPPNISEILSELSISDVDYYNALVTSKNDNYELHLIRPPNSCFVSNYFEDGLRAWQTNTNIQPVFNEYEARTYMCQFQFLKI